MFFVGIKYYTCNHVVLNDGAVGSAVRTRETIHRDAKPHLHQVEMPVQDAGDGEVQGGEVATPVALAGRAQGGAGGWQQEQLEGGEGEEAGDIT